MRTGEHGVESFLKSPATRIIAFTWGLAEATFFFIVPDVFLMLIAGRDLRLAIRAAKASLFGALFGGALVYAFGLHAPATARDFLLRIPGIGPALIASVEAQMREYGLTALMFGPLRGTPYKIYAAVSGMRGGGVLPFMLVSIPARYGRFFVGTLLANMITSALAPWTLRNIKAEFAMWASFWGAFYFFYFSRFG